MEITLSSGFSMVSAAVMSAVVAVLDCVESLDCDAFELRDDLPRAVFLVGWETPPSKKKAQLGDLL